MEIVQLVQQIGIEHNCVEDLDRILDVLFQQKLHVRVEGFDAILCKCTVPKCEKKNENQNQNRNKIHKSENQLDQHN
jgi:hypothetical protein